MAGKTKVFASSITRQWTSLVGRKPINVLILCPYLTSQTAEAVIQKAQPYTCKIYTLFCVEVFATGASSLTTVKKLVAQGYQVHHVDELHAKVVLTDEAFSVGSQNLTAKGARNLEVSAIITDATQATALKEKIRNQIKNAMLITLDDIAAIEPLVLSLRKEYAKFHKKISTVDKQANDELRRLATQRELAVERAREEEKRKTYERIRLRSASIRRVIQRSKKSSASVRVRLTKVSYGDEYSSGSYSTLKASPTSTLLNWQFNSENGDIERLEKTHRYLMIQAETGRLAWPAFFETQISKIARNLTETTSTLLLGVPTKLEYELLWDSSDIQTRNVRITMTCPKLELKIVTDGYFSLNKLVVTERKDYSDPLWRHHLTEFKPRARRQILSVMDDQNRFSEELRRLLLRPFKFEKNSHNEPGGLSAFLMDLHSQDFWIRLRQIEGANVFVISEQ